MTANDAKFLNYIRNTNGGATVQGFVEDWEPIGRQVWNDLVHRGLVTLDDLGHIYLTELGVHVLREDDG